MFVIIKNAKTGHEQRIQRSDWEGYHHLYVGYHLAKDTELEQFEKVNESTSGDIKGQEDNQAEPEETMPEDAGGSSTGDKPKPKGSRKKKDA